MSPIQSGLIWMSGHSPAQCRDATPAERWALSRAGLLVLVAYLVASINWAVVGWVYTAKLVGEIRWIAAALIMLTGSGVMVLLLDRSFLYLMDTAASENGVLNGLRNLVFALFRIAVILGFAMLTAQFTMPVYLGADLDVAALDMIEERESDRIGSLAEAAGLDERKQFVENASDVVGNWTLAIENGQKLLDTKLAAARACWGRWERSVQSYTSYEVSRETARTFAGPRGIARECVTADGSAKAQRAELDQVRDSHRLATEALTAAQTEFDATNRQIAKTMAERGAIDKRALNATSATVLGEALKNDPGIFAKWAMITALQTVLELLPFLVKLFTGSSAVGARVAEQRHEEKNRIDARRDLVNDNRATRHRIAATTNKAMMDAANSVEVQMEFRQYLEAYVVALAPQEGLRAMLAELASNATDVREFLARYPQYAPLIAEAWDRAIRESTESLSGLEKSLAEQLMGGLPIDPDAAPPLKQTHARETSDHEH